MRRKEYIQRENGAVVKLQEYTTHDLLPIQYMLEHISKEVFQMYGSPNSVGRKYKILAARLGNEIFRRFLIETMNRLMESDRLLIKDKIYLYIGTPRNRTVVKARKKRMYGAAGGPYKRYHGVVLDGVDHKYFLRMPFRRRKELAERIKSGQHFYYTPWL